jgi:hypothetical protein
MKTKLNIALEGTCSGDVTGGLLSWTGEPFRRFCFLLICRKGVEYRQGDSKERAAQYGVMAKAALNMTPNYGGKRHG